MTHLNVPNSGLAAFPFNGAEVRTVLHEGEPAFCAKDVAEILGYSNPSAALAQHCKGVAFHYPLQTAGGIQEARFIREPDLYRLVIGSKLPQAVEFEKHVMEVILPQIRKTGGYRMPGNYIEALTAHLELAKENEHLRLTVQQQAPAVEFVQSYVQAEGLFGIRQTAKILGVTQNAFVALCLSKSVLFREGGSLQPYSQWLEAGYFEVKTGEKHEHAFTQTRFTSKGVEWVRGRLELSKLLATMPLIH